MQPDLLSLVFPLDWNVRKMPLGVSICSRQQKNQKKKKKTALDPGGLKRLGGVDFNRPQTPTAISSQQPEGRFAALLAQVKSDG